MNLPRLDQLTHLCTVLAAAIAIATTIAIASIMTGSAALADLMVTPKRVILTTSENKATLHLLNDSNETRTYELGWRQMRMDETGNLLEDTRLVVPGNASSLIILSPTRVVLGPGESQSVRIRARLPAELPFGEYISHLSFSPISRPAPTDDSGISGAQTQIRVMLGIAIPVIIRHGDLTASASVQITGIDIQRGVLSIDLARQGTAGIIGNIEGYWGLPGKPGTLIARLNNVAVYPNINKISRDIPLDLPEGFQFQPGLLHVVYRNPSTLDILSQTTIRVE